MRGTRNELFVHIPHVKSSPIESVPGFVYFSACFIQRKTHNIVVDETVVSVHVDGQSILFERERKMVSLLTIYL